MFKKGQLVKTNGGSYGVIRMVSEKVSDSYYITNHSWDFGMWLYGSKLELIGNNFKFKGAK